MEKSQLMNLDLRSPLVFTVIPDAKEAPDTAPAGENEEILLCFDLDPAQSKSIEPDRELLLGALVFAGRSVKGENAPQGKTVALPAGNYLFMQSRNEGAMPLSREEWLDLAIEQQKDGLWEIYKPGNRLFVRFLFEDGCAVTQLFRPL